MRNRRIVVTHYGGPEALQLIEEDCPEPKKGEVRVKVLASGVAMPDIMAREGIHPETPKVPYTPGWDLVGVVEETGQIVTAMPIHGAYAEYICLPRKELVPVPDGLDPTETVSLVLNYITAYQMMHRSAKVKAGQRALIHGATGGVGSALMQLGRLAGLTMYGTCSAKSERSVTEMGGMPIDYRGDFVNEIQRLTGDGVDVVFDMFSGEHLWESRKALRYGGKVIGYGNTTTLRSEGLGSERSGRRNRFFGFGAFARYIVGGLILPGKKRVIPYSIQTLKRLRPTVFQKDLMMLLELLREKKIKPLVAHRFPLSEARKAQELLAMGGVTGKIVLVTMT
jgi:NADPH:quinone reductase